MYSDAYVSDFDSDDDEVAWPRYDDDDEEEERDDHSVSTVELQPSTCSGRHVYEFGEFEETHGWVQCRSRSEPGRLYFHNMHSGCDTWYRPISRFINVPTISLGRATCGDDLRTSDLELMSVSDDERERKLPSMARDRAGSSMKTQLDTFARWYRAPKMNSTSDIEDNLSESNNAFVGEHRDEIDVKRNNDYDDDDNNNDSEMKCSQFCIDNFLETSIVVGKNEINTENRSKVKDDDNASTTSSSSLSTATKRVFTVPRLKKIGFEDQIVKWQRTRTAKDKGGPRKIICEMYGVRTVSYDLPPPDEVRPQAGVKSTRLSDSESDNEDNKLLLDVKTNVSSHCKPDWHDFTTSLPNQLLLSDASSSSSSSSSSSKSSDSSSSSSTCSTCSTCCTLCE